MHGKRKVRVKPLRILLGAVGITAGILVMISLDGGLQALHVEREEVSKVIVETYEPWGIAEFTEPQDLDLLVEYLNGFHYTRVTPLDVNRSGTSAGLLRIIVSGEEKIFALEPNGLGLPVEGGYWYIAEENYFQPLLDSVTRVPETAAAVR